MGDCNWRGNLISIFPLVIVEVLLGATQRYLLHLVEEFIGTEEEKSS